MNTKLPESELERDFTIQHIQEGCYTCPMTGHPDYATVVFSYVPDAICIELKAMKLYLRSFRNKGFSSKRPPTRSSKTCTQCATRDGPASKPSGRAMTLECGRGSPTGRLQRSDHRAVSGLRRALAVSDRGTYARTRIHSLEKHAHRQSGSCISSALAAGIAVILGCWAVRGLMVNRSDGLGVPRFSEQTPLTVHVLAFCKRELSSLKLSFLSRKRNRQDSSGITEIIRVESTDRGALGKPLRILKLNYNEGFPIDRWMKFQRMLDKWSLRENDIHGTQIHGDRIFTMQLNETDLTDAQLNEALKRG